MQINTTRFGYIDVEPERVIFFKNGLFGLENLQKYVLLTPENMKPFSWLQSVEDGNIAMVVIDPFNIKPDYTLSIHDDVFNELKAEREEDIIILNVVVIPKDFKKMTANLMAPILINAQQRLGKQIILNDSNYPIRYPVFDMLKRKEG